MTKILLNVEHFIQKIPEDEFNKSEYLKEKGTNEKINLQSCGLTCLRMCIKYFRNKDIPLARLMEEAFKSGSFVETGLIHFKFIQLARTYGLEGCLIKEERIDRFITLVNFMLSSNHLVIASVKPCLFPLENTDRKNGHLVLIKGIDEKNFYLNDPSYLENRCELNKIVEHERFFSNFSGNTICVANTDEK